MSKQILTVEGLELLDAAQQLLRTKGLLLGRVVAQAEMLLEDRDGKRNVIARFVTFDTDKAALEYVQSLAKGEDNGGG